MKVLHICSDYFGTAIYKNLISCLTYKGVTNTVYVPKYYSGAKESPNILTSPQNYNTIDRVLFYKKEKIGYNDICNRININEISIIHSHNLFSGGYIAYMLNKNYGIPYVVAVRNTDLNVFFKYMIHLRKLGINIMNSASKVVFISPSYKEKVISTYIPTNMQNKFRDKSIIIPNGIDSNFLSNLNKKSLFIWDKKHINLISIGELNKNKNIDTTIKACRYLLNMNYDVKLTLVGEIQNEKYLNVGNKYDFVNYYPKCSKENILMHLRNADILIMPSKTETFGLVYAEAMSQGVPVIYTKDQGFDGFFENGTVGYSIKADNYIDIANSVVRIYEKYQVFSDNCIKGVELFNWNDIASTYINLYKS